MYSYHIGSARNGLFTQHTGGEPPVACGVCIDLLFRDGNVVDATYVDAGWRWDHQGSNYDITGWRKSDIASSPAFADAASAPGYIRSDGHGQFIAHNTGDTPPPTGATVDLLLRNGMVMLGTDTSWDWLHRGYAYDIVGWRYASSGTGPGDKPLDPDASRGLNPVHDPVEYPAHYTAGGIECIDAIRAALTPDEFRGFCKGNMIKYTWREGRKGGTEDIQKARWYGKQLTAEAS